MAATQENIDNFIVSIRDSVSVFANKVAKKEMLGFLDLFYFRQKLSILTVYLEIVEKYFSGMYSNLITGFINGSGANWQYTTFSSTSTTINSAIQTETDARSLAWSTNFFNITEGEEIVVEFTHTQNSGERPVVYLASFPIGTTSSNTEQVEEGHNIIKLVATKTEAVKLLLVENSLPTDFSTSEIFVYRISTDNNFFTVEEIKEIILRINLLLDTNYTIDDL